MCVFYNLYVLSVPGCEMQNIKKGGDSITSSLANLSLVNEGLIKKSSGVLLPFTNTSIAPSILALSLLAGGNTRNVEAHLNKLVSTRSSLGTLCAGTAELSIGSFFGQSHLYSDLISTGQVSVADFRVGKFKRRSVLNAEGELCFRELGLSPIPTSQCVFLGFENSAVPVLEDFDKSIVVLLLKAIKLNHARGSALKDFDFVSLGSATPMGSGNVVVIESKGFAAARRFPAKTSFGESAFAALFGKIQINVVEALTIRRNLRLALCLKGMNIPKSMYGNQCTSRNCTIRVLEAPGRTHMALMATT